MEPDFQNHGPQPPPLATPVAYHPTLPHPADTRSTSRWLLVLLALVLFGSLLLNMVLFGVVGLAGIASIEMDRGVRERYLSPQTDSDNKIAVISLEGTILRGEGFIKRQIDRAMDDQHVKAVVLRVNSPGGTITGSDSIYHQLRALRQERKIPIVVSMGGLAASGGYYVSMACGHEGVIFAEPTTWTGSIGVIIPHYNVSELMGQWGIEEDSIVSHPLKQIGSFTKAMTDEERKILQQLVDDSFALFKDVIKEGRAKFDKDSQALDKLATGQIYTANQAKQSGLIDEIGFLEDAVAKAIVLAGLDKDDVTVVEYRREPNLADVLMGTQTKNRRLDLATMLDMTAPRAFFLCSWLPPLISSTKPTQAN